MFKRIVGGWRALARWKKGLIVLAGLAGAFGGGLTAFVLYRNAQSDSNRYINRWFDHPADRPELTTIQRTPCPGAPFLLPSDGLIGLLWDDSVAPYNLLHRHSGLDIFGDGQPGKVPVYAAYEGALTRLPDWKSTVIIRHDDPLKSGRIIWTYYTHMASRDGKTSYIVADFPAGSQEVWVKQGTLLGYQGEYSGNGTVPIGMHVHFSIVTSDPDGSFKNESRVGNTLDPSPYLGMSLNIQSKPSRPIHCSLAR